MNEEDDIGEEELEVVGSLFFISAFVDDSGNFLRLNGEGMERGCVDVGHARSVTSSFNDERRSDYCVSSRPYSWPVDT